jgi:predicted Zn finger-like uncharacterized protein
MSLEKCQSVCPKCGKSHISVYKVVDDDLIVDRIEGFCPKCNHTWVIATKEDFK